MAMSEMLAERLVVSRLDYRNEPWEAVGPVVDGHGMRVRSVDNGAELVVYFAKLVGVCDEFAWFEPTSQQVAQLADKIAVPPEAMEDLGDVTGLFAIGPLTVKSTWPCHVMALRAWPLG